MQPHLPADELLSDLDIAEDDLVTVALGTVHKQIYKSHNNLVYQYNYTHHNIYKFIMYLKAIVIQ